MIPINVSTATINITGVDEKMMSRCYFARCIECDLCDDNCCSYGCPVDISEVIRIMAYKHELESRLEIPAAEWFMEDTQKRPEFPSGMVKITRINNGKCVFHDNISGGLPFASSLP